jgi:hypothetical protein
MPTPPSSRAALAVLARAAWWGGLDRRDTAAHIFVGRNEVSACGKVEVKKVKPVKPHQRGCRICGRSMGLIDSVAQAVST